MEYQINFIKIIDALLGRIKEIILVGILAMLLAYLFIDGSGSNTYAASATIYAASNASYQESVTGMNIMRDYVNVIKSHKVAEKASALISHQVSPERIVGMVNASYQADSKIITILATSPDPAIAISVANAVANAFIQEIISITAAESVKVLDSAYSAQIVVNAASQAMKMRLLITASAMIAFIGAIAAIAVFDTRVSSAYEVTLGGKLELLGVIPDRKI